MKGRINPLALLALSSLNHPTPATYHGEGAFMPEVSTVAQGLVNQGLAPSISVAVINLGGNGSVNTGFGTWGNRSEDGDPARPDTLYAIGSCSKAFLSAAIGILIDDFAQGRNVTALPDGLNEFTFDTKLQALFPGGDVWALEDEWATKKANIRDILSHVSGLTRNEFAYIRGDTPLDLGKRLRYLRPGYELREQWSYMNLLYYFGAHIVDTYSGKTYTEFVKERIFDPLNMTMTTFSTQEAEATGLMSQAWAFVGRRIPVVIEDPATANLVAGAGGVISNAIDMAKWAATMLNGGVDPVTNKTIIPRAAYAAVTSARSVEFAAPRSKDMSIVAYGMGWERSSFLGHSMITHDGGFPGFVSKVIILPDDNLAVLSLVNTDLTVASVVPLAIIHSILEPTRPYDPLSGLPNLGGGSSGPKPDPSANCTKENVPIERFAGTYVNPGYGNLTFCAPSQTDASAYCKSALSDLAAISPNGTVEPHTLIAASPRIVSHVSMQRTCNAGSDRAETFKVIFQSIYPKGYGRNQTPFAEPLPSSLPQADVECILNESGEVVGCGWLNLEPGHKRTGTLQERADVWWEKI